MTDAVARRMWGLFEPIHAVTYFTQHARAAFEAAGLRGFWRGYFAGRAAPLGPVGDAPVYAAFFSFTRPMVARALPDVWSRATPEAAIDARRAGARAALAEMVSDVDCAEAAALLRAAAERVEVTGRVLAAANTALPWPEPDEPLDVLWHAATILREHRGDGHVAALVAAGVDGCEAVVWQAAVRGEGRGLLQQARGWTEEDWAAAAGSLARRGWLDASGTATAAGRAARDELEATTDRLAAAPWDKLGPERTERCAELLRPLAERTAAVMPFPNPIGVPVPRTA